MKRSFLLLIAALLLSCHTAMAESDYVFPEDIRPLIQTRWGQHYPFNLLCPKTENVNGETVRMLAGCGPVAMAQMVNYLRYPSTSPDKSYEYEWHLMYNTLTVGLRKEELVAVAKLISDCGISSLTDYGEKGSSTSLSRMMGALKRLFNYSDQISLYERSQFNTPERDSLFRQLIFTELKARRPVLYRGYSEKEKVGHLFIIDGCKKGKVHVNMGWGGNRDGYYDLDDLSGYSQGQELLTDVADSLYQAETREVTLNEPGTLETLLSKDEQLTTRHIKLSGKMDPSDFAVLRRMLQTGLLRTIDMEGVDITELPESAFLGCSYLSHFVAPRTLQRTGNKTFYRCGNLNRVVFSEGLTTVGNDAFYSCANLLNVQLPGSTKAIGNYAFASCSTLLSVQLPEGVERIGDYAFAHCTHLYTMTLPKSVCKFGMEVFKNCERLTHLRLAPDNPYLTIGKNNEIVPREKEEQ